jgi:hypothetical protein
MYFKRSITPRSKGYHVAAIDVVRAHACPQGPQNVFRFRRFECHHFKVNSGVPVMGAAYQQGHWLISLVDKVEAGLNACQDSIIMELNINIFNRPLFCFCTIVRTK